MDLQYHTMMCSLLKESGKKFVVNPYICIINRFKCLLRNKPKKGIFYNADQ